MNEQLTWQLRVELERKSNPENARAMSKYMKNQFPFFGIKSLELKELLFDFLLIHGMPQPDLLPDVILECWAEPEREFQYIGTGLLRRSIQSSKPSLVSIIETLIISKSWWDTVDTIATNCVGPFFLHFPGARDNYLPIWRNSNNMWLRRTSILFQLNYKNKTDFPLLASIINDNLGSKEFFINKAIGWALREYSKTDRAAVIEFCEQNPLHILSRREALKWIIAHPR